MNIESLVVTHDKEYGFSGSIEASHDDGEATVNVHISVCHKTANGDHPIGKCLVGLAQDVCDVLSETTSMKHRASDFDSWMF